MKKDVFLGFLSGLFLIGDFFGDFLLYFSSGISHEDIEPV